VRCDANLNNCTRPILISGDQKSIQFGDVTMGPDGRTYITWEQDNDLKTDFQPPEHMKFWIRVAPPGSTRFGPLHTNDFRVATYPKNELAMVGGKPRVFVAWDGCKARPASDSVCEEPRIKVARSDDLGKTWGSPR